MIKTRQTKSGVRYEVRYRDPTGRERSRTFTTKKLAEKYEREQRTEVGKGSWLDPRHGSQTFAEFMDKWLAERHDLRPRTLELYRSLLKRHLKPTFGALTMAKLSASSTAVRSWNAELAREHPATAAKAYRLLHQLCSTAVADGVVGRNPCTVKGAGQEHSPERPTATVAEVAALAGAMPADLQLVILLAAWCQLRRGELLGLERRDFDLLHGTVAIERSVNYVAGGRQVGPPKTEAGVRTLALPPHLLGDIEEHLRQVGPEGNAPIFTGPHGRAVRPHTLWQFFLAARQSIGRPDLTMHDLRHSGLTWSAATGATPAELMRRAGHKSSAAAMRYQHATADRDAALAEALSAMARTATVTSVSERPRDIRGIGQQNEQPAEVVQGVYQDK
jgi:integrase